MSATCAVEKVRALHDRLLTEVEARVAGDDRPALAPGYQGRLFAPAGDRGPCWWRVVDAAGTRQGASRHLVMVVGQARALAMTDGRAWIVTSDDDAVTVTYDGDHFAVVPCGPGWSATAQRILAKHGLERSN
jgi:hypothetical protein